ncbi:hypothetical protein SAMN05428961_103182 [Paenibacillus sp. OK060]|nr:hypothetical protein SAMN05428961_103182 [Paenibacillus sp. OK060]
MYKVLLVDDEFIIWMDASHRHDLSYADSSWLREPVGSKARHDYGRSADSRCESLGGAGSFVTMPPLTLSTCMRS